MIMRGILGLAVALALAACADGGFVGRTGQFSGVWLYEFEGSMFVEGASAIPAERPTYEETDWLEYHFDEPHIRQLVEEWRYDEARSCYLVQPFLVTFIGRRTHHPFDGAGHMSLHRKKVTVSRTLSIRRLGPSFCYEEDRMLGTERPQANPQPTAG
jgi:hypothetical protein